MENFNYEAYERQCELEEAVKHIVPQVKEACEKLIQSLTDARKILDECPIYDAGLDNT